MSALPKPRKLTEAEYLAIEEAAEYKSEFFDGEMFAMSGASEAHCLVRDNLVGILYALLKGGPCRVMSGDMRVKVQATGLYTYPDILIVCGPRRFDPLSRSTLLNPTAVIEVLSPGTERYDRGKKFDHYRLIPSLTEYVLVAQDEPRVERFTRQADGTWALAVFADPAGSATLATVPGPIPLADIYADVTFPDPPARFQPEE